MEFIGKTYQEALQKAKDYYELPDDMLQVKVLSEGSKGFLGIGAKDYTIDVSRKPEKNIDVKVEPDIKSEQKNTKNEQDEHTDIAGISQNDIEKAGMAEEFLKDVYLSIGINPDIDIKINEQSINIMISGDKASTLIGKRGQSLDALQFLTGIVANRGGQYKKIIIDIENYRSKRKISLEQYARSMARKAAREKRNIRLEPMTPYERRIVHFALQGDKNVNTVSQGQDPDRYVVISYKGYRDFKSRQDESPRYDYGDYRDDLE